MAHNDHRAAQGDLWDLTLRTVATIQAMEAAMKRVAAIVYPLDAQVSKSILAKWSEAQQCFWFHKYEQQAIPLDDLHAAFDELARRGNGAGGRLRKSLAHADQLLGRATFMEALVGRPAAK